MKNKFLLLLLLQLLFSCDTEKTNTEQPITQKHIEKMDIMHMNAIYPPSPQIIPFKRTEISKNLLRKIEQDEPLVVHLFVPLWFGDATKAIADGENLSANLYWGAGYGIKYRFKKLRDWKLIYEHKTYDMPLLERVVFMKTFKNNTKVYFVADAYSGREMYSCMFDFLSSLAGNISDTLELENDTIPIYSNADLIGFNGHNGFLDTQIEYIKNTDNKQKDAVMLGCLTHIYVDYLNYANSYPLVVTTDFFAPEAYVIEAVINSWAVLNSEEQIKKDVSEAYAKFQKIDKDVSFNMFHYGWEYF